MAPRLLDDLVHMGLPVIGAALGTAKAVQGPGGRVSGAWWAYVLGGWVAGWCVSRGVLWLLNDLPAIVPTKPLETLPASLERSTVPI